MNKNTKCKTIYILGHSRSGSTILNILLGNIKSVFAAGEINNYLKSSWINDHYCSCGNPVSKCDFWPQVQESLQDYATPSAEELVEITHQLEIWRNLPRQKLRTTVDQRTKFDNYIKFYAELIKSISRHSESEWVVDASKSPMRLINLLNANELDVSAIHIVRDPRGVCWSLLKAASKNVEAGVQVDLPSIHYTTTIKNLYINALMAFFAKRKMPSKHLTLRYDELVNQSQQSIEKIGSLLDVDTAELKHLIQSKHSLQQMHNIAGNRLRMKSNITLKYDQSWKSGLSTFQYLAITALALPLLLIYRFPLLSR